MIVVVIGKAEPYRKGCGEAAGIRRSLLIVVVIGKAEPYRKGCGEAAAQLVGKAEPVPIILQGYNELLSRLDA